MKLENLLPSVAKMELNHPVNGPTGIFLSLIGQDSKVFRDKAREIARNLNDKQGKVNPLDLEKQNVELVACCIVGWSDEEAFGPYSPARALELMQMDELSWVKEEVESFIKERSNFFRGTGKVA